MNTKILLSGDGGQGIQIMADMISRAAFARDLHLTSIANYGLEQRGGVSLNFLQISDSIITYPKFSKPDIIIILSQQADDRTQEYQHADCQVLQINDYKEKLDGHKIPRKSWNIFFLSMLTKILEEKDIVKVEDVFALLEKKLESKQNWEENKKAFDLGKGIHNS